MERFKQYLNKLTPLSDSEFDVIAGYFSYKPIKKGEYLIEQGQHCQHIAFILKGSLRMFYINHLGVETTSCFCTQDGFTTSYKSFITKTPSHISIQAMEDGELLLIHYHHLQELYQRSLVWNTISRIVTNQEYLTLEKYASVLNNETAKEKYLRLLQEQPSIVHKATVEDMASFLGVSRRTLSRIRKEITS